MGEDQKYYDVDDYLRWKRSQGKNNKVAPRPNLLAAATWLRRFFDARKTNWAAMGSLAMLCLGARREIPDIHIVYDDKDFQRIKMKLQADPRVRLPRDMNSMFSSKLLISTGPKYKDAGCTENADIEVEMIPPGSHGTPPSDVLRNNQATLSLNLDGKITNIKGLNIIYLVNTTVHMCTSQDLLWDPQKDLLWLCRKYGKEIQSIRGQLNARQVKENFLGTHFFATMSPDEQRLCYQVLLGKEPPPSMFLTPAPSHGQPTSAIARLPIPSHKSAPSLKDNMQKQSNFLRPPMNGKAKTAPGVPLSGAVSKTSPNAVANAQQTVPSEATRDSRSRYRNSSAPTTPSASRNVSPEAATVRQAKNIMEFRPDHMQQRSMIYQAQTINMQNLAPAQKPQVVRTKKSLPRMDGQITSFQAVPVFAHKPTTTSIVSQANAQLAPVAASKPSERKARPHDAVSEAHSYNSAHPSASSAQPQVVAHTHPAHKVMAQRNSMMPQSHNAVAKSSTVSYSEHSMPETPSKGLVIVGPAGLYPTPPKPLQQPQKSQTAAPTMQNNTQVTSNNFVFELDAASPQVETFAQAAPTAGFVAELPADNNVPSQTTLQRFDTLPETPVSPLQGPTHLAYMPAYRDSPVSPPTTFTPLASLIQPINAGPMTEALKAPKLAPSPPAFDSLPPSLLIGFRGPRRPTNAESRTRASSQSSNGSNPSATLNMYQRYYSPPNSREASPNNALTSGPNSRHPSPSRVPVYKAYTPPITPPMQPKKEPAQFQQPTSIVQNQVLTPPALIPATRPAPQQGTPVPMERASEFVRRESPPAILRAGANVPQPLKSTKAFHLPNPLAANPPTPRNASHMKHDSHQGPQSVPQEQSAKPQPEVYALPPQAASSQYIAFSAQNAAPTQPPRQSSLHQRNVSNESNTSTTSHDSEKLAQEYQLDLPSFEDGFGSQPESNAAEAELRKSYRPSYAGTGYGAQYKLGSPDFGTKQGKFMDEFHFS
ncbi:uncharacterized protein N0V89_006919 [Didymosphaeria variabile]|uniref:Uncharacterized protein n=1 Tax=Didymosphaeria variabile TaxID=1932322 RepID=A0A9W8XJV4_9PLEO|nr:uncharacterized protein N0V89_006919 [Didymosphaeria variabile]KAJ4351576.1 hypothetical protein N0V89_006919 [Didymosphaeria variabile]